jgi:hypothetical protein
MAREINQKPPETIEEPEYVVYAEDADAQEAMRSRFTEALRRESYNILSEASQGALAKDRSTALIGYLKFLNELEKLQKSKLEDLTDEELEAASKNEDK